VVKRVLNESSYEDFISSYSDEIKEAIKQMKQIDILYNKIPEDKLKELLEPFDTKMMDIYDKSNVNWLIQTIGKRVTIKDIAEQSIFNMNNTGTEPQFLLDLINTYLIRLKKIVSNL